MEPALGQDTRVYIPAVFDISKSSNRTVYVSIAKYEKNGQGDVWYCCLQKKKCYSLNTKSCAETTEKLKQNK